MIFTVIWGVLIFTRFLGFVGLPKAIELNQIIGSSHIIMSSAGRITGIDGWKALLLAYWHRLARN